MRVICIRNDIYGVVNSESMPILTIGETYTVIDESEYGGDFFYLIEEVSTNFFRYWYPKRHFCPQSNIDETELIKERELIEQY